jgi:urease accessory protein
VVASPDWLAWQIVDSAFPTGAFAHSWGLESAWQHGEVPDTDALQVLLEESIWQAGYGSLPLANAAYADPARLDVLVELADAFLLSAVANRASRVQGRTLVSTAARVFQSPELSAIAERAATQCLHVAPASGVVFQALGLPLATGQRVVLYTAARGVLSAAVRLGIVGSYEAQGLQARCAPVLDAVVEACAALDEDDLAQTAPFLDLMQAGHDRLYSRLFQS